MKKLFMTIFLLALLASSGCAIVPVALTGASFATPQAVSLALTGAKMAHKGVLVAADERDTGDMIHDQFLDLQASAVAATTGGVDANVHAYNGQIYVVGEYESDEAREELVASLHDIEGVEDVKGVLKPARDGEPLPVNDSFAENKIAANLFTELGIKSANVDVEVVQNEAVLVGVVETHEEERELVDFVNSLKSRKNLQGIRITSLVAVQKDHDEGINTADLEYCLRKTPPAGVVKAMPAVTETSARPMIVDDKTVARTPDPEVLKTLFDKYKPYYSKWTQARVRLKRRILDMAESETDATARTELRELAGKIRTDRNTSIALRLEKTMLQSSCLRTKTVVNDLLKQYAPEKAVSMHSLAMH